MRVIAKDKDPATFQDYGMKFSSPFLNTISSQQGKSLHLAYLFKDLKHGDCTFIHGYASPEMVCMYSNIPAKSFSLKSGQYTCICTHVCTSLMGSVGVVTLLRRVETTKGCTMAMESRRELPVREYVSRAYSTTCVHCMGGKMMCKSLIEEQECLPIPQTTTMIQTLQGTLSAGHSIA